MCVFPQEFGCAKHIRASEVQAPAISLFGTTYKEEGPSVSRYTILRPNRSVPTVIIQATHTCFFCFCVFCLSFFSNTDKVYHGNGCQVWWFWHSQDQGMRCIVREGVSEWVGSDFSCWTFSKWAWARGRLVSWLRCRISLSILCLTHCSIHTHKPFVRLLLLVKVHR